MSASTWIKRTVALTAVAAAAFAIGGPTANAGTAAGNFVVQANVTSACTFTTATLNFGNYTTGTVTPVNGSTTWSVNCPGATSTQPIPVTFTMSATGGFVMKDGGGTGPDSLNYLLCADAGCNTVYGNGTAGPSVGQQAAPQAFTLFGQIPANQAVPAGAYTQTVNVTLTY